MTYNKDDKELLELLKKSLSCYKDEDFEAYLAGEMAEHEQKQMETHLEACALCRKRFYKTQQYMSRCLDIMKQELEQAFEEPGAGPYRLAASSEDQEHVAVQLGTACGLAVDINTEQGFIIKCVAKVSTESVSKGRLIINVEQISSNGRRPFDFIQTKLIGLFTDQYLAPFELGNRYIFVEIESEEENAVFEEAKSLTLAIIMAIVSAVTGKEIEPGVAFSGRIEQGGALRPPVSNISAKLEAAKRGGIDTVILPRVNEQDCPGWAKDDKGMEVLFFSHLAHVLEHFAMAPEEIATPKPGPPAEIPSSHEEMPLSLFSGGKDVEIALKLSSRADIAAEVLSAVMEAAEELSQARSEQRPITTALVVGNSERIAPLLPESEMKLKTSGRNVTEAIEDLRMLSTAVNGTLMCFLIDQTGGLHSIRKIPELRADYDLSPLMSNFDLSYAVISEVTKAFIFAVMPKGNRIHLFYDGELIAKYINGQWVEVDLTDLRALLDSLSQQKRINKEALYRIIKAGFTMANEGHGALFAIYDEYFDISGKYDDRLRRLGIEFSPCKIEDISEPELINYAKEDGAVVVDSRGEIRTIRAYLRPSSGVSVEFEKGVGARHMSAQRFSAEVQCVSIVVSEDGSITIYCDGKRIWRL